MDAPSKPGPRLGRSRILPVFVRRKRRDVTKEPGPFAPRRNSSPTQIVLRDAFAGASILRHPREADRPAAEIALSSGALATSGDYERFIEAGGRRYCHILEPKTGWPAHGLSSVSVISDRCLVAGILSTAAMLKGRGGAAWLRSLGVRHLATDEDGNFCGTEPPLTRFG